MMTTLERLRAARKGRRASRSEPRFRRGRAPMIDTNSAFEKARRLAVVSGMRAMLGPALLSAAEDRPWRKGLAIAALGELVVDKLPLVPSRASLVGMVPRALAGAWVAKTVMEQEGGQE